MMDKESIKQIINDFIDSVDEVREFSISDEVEEIDTSTLGEERILRRPTGITNIYITAYKEQDKSKSASSGKHGKTPPPKPQPPPTLSR